MQKITTFVAIFTVCVIAVLAEFLANDYSFSDSGAASVIDASGQEYSIEELLLRNANVEDFDFSMISEGDLRDSGLYNYVLKKDEYDGYLFGAIDLTEFYDLKVVKLKLIDNALNIPTIVGAIYEFDLEEKSLANEIYRIVNERALAKDGYSINKTNSYGEESFFINDDLRLGTAFLLVKSGKKVYAFTYPKVRHENIKKLIKILHGKEDKNDR